MQTALRAAFQELSRSAATSLLVWASGRCPPCSPSLSCPNLSCAAFPTLPDCVCQGGARVQACEGTPLYLLVFAGLFLLVLGFVLGRATWRVSAPLDLRQVARQQAFAARQIRDGGAGSWHLSPGSLPAARGGALS